jgi:hypothetical protein
MALQTRLGAVCLVRRMERECLMGSSVQHYGKIRACTGAMMDHTVREISHEVHKMLEGGLHRLDKHRLRDCNLCVRQVVDHLETTTIVRIREA